MTPEEMERRIAALEKAVESGTFRVPRTVTPVTPSEVTRGRLVMDYGAAGEADLVQVVVKGDDDAYSLVTLAAPAYGEINNSGVAVATTVTTAGTFYATEGTSVLLAQGSQFDSPGNGRLRYTGSPTREMLVSCYADFTANTNNLTITYQIRKNGDANTDAQVQSNKGNAADVRAVSLTALIEMAQDDYLELWLTADANGVTVTKQNFNLNAVAIG